MTDSVSLHRNKKYKAIKLLLTAGRMESRPPRSFIKAERIVIP
jgi:hypothetical protein